LLQARRDGGYVVAPPAGQGFASERCGNPHLAQASEQVLDGIDGSHDVLLGLENDFLYFEIKRTDSKGLLITLTVEFAVIQTVAH
jgi:hypothetical protein